MILSAVTQAMATWSRASLRRRVVSVVLVTCGATPARADLEFSAYATVGHKTRFVVADTASQAKSNWILLGDEFQGYTLVAFDRDRDVLSARKDDFAIHLPLKASRVERAKVTVVNDSVAHLDPKTPEIRIERFGAPRHGNSAADEIALIVEIIKRSAVVSLHGGNSSRRGVTHALWLPERLWFYDSRTGQLGMVHLQTQPIYQIGPEDKPLFDRLIASNPPRDEK